MLKNPSIQFLCFSSPAACFISFSDGCFSFFSFSFSFSLSFSAAFSFFSINAASSFFSLSNSFNASFLERSSAILSISLLFSFDFATSACAFAAASSRIAIFGPSPPSAHAPAFNNCSMILVLALMHLPNRLLAAFATLLTVTCVLLKYALLQDKYRIKRYKN